MGFWSKPFTATTEMAPPGPPVVGEPVIRVLSVQEQSIQGEVSMKNSSSSDTVASSICDDDINDISPARKRASATTTAAAAICTTDDLNGPVQGSPYNTVIKTTTTTCINPQQDQIVATTTKTMPMTTPHAFGRDEIVTSSIRFFVVQLILQVGLGATVVGVYFYGTMAFSELYLIGLIVALGIGMIVQGMMRAWSLKQLQSEFLGRLKDEEGRGTSSPTVATVQALVVERYTDGFDLAATIARCHANPAEQCECTPNTTASQGIPMTMTCDEDDAFNPYFHAHAVNTNATTMESSSHYENMETGTLKTQQQQHSPPVPIEPTAVGSLHSIVVQYEVPVPRGYIRSDGHIIQSDGVNVVVLKELKDVHPDLYFCSHVEMIYQTHEPKSAYAKPLLQHYAPKHQNGRVTIGITVVGMGFLMSLNALPLGVLDWYAMAANGFLFVATALVVYYRSLLKHAATVRGDAARIVAWQAREGMDNAVPWEVFEATTMQQQQQ